MLCEYEQGIILIDQYSRYIVHYSLLRAIDADSVSLEAQAAIERLRKDSIAEPLKQEIMDHHSSPWNSGWCLSRTISHRISSGHTPEQNGIVERANKTMRESLAPVILTDYEQTRSEISRIIQYYNNNRRHSSLNYLTPMPYYRGNPEKLLRIRESKIERARILRRERNMKERKGGETAGTVS